MKEILLSKKKLILATIVIVAFSLTLAGSFAKGTQFSDLPRNHWAYDNIMEIYDKGLISGYPDGTFRPNELLTRAEAAVIIWRLNELLEGRDLPEREAVTEAVPGPLDGPLVDTSPLVVKRVNPDEYPPGSTVYIIFDYHNKTKAKHQELGSMLALDYPGQGLAMFSSFEKFMEKPISENGFGIRKEYFGDYPIFMEHMSNSATFTIFPLGYDDPYYGIKPGQVEEYIQ